jgi:hypothetical protein
MDEQWRLEREREVREGQQHERQRVGFSAGTKIAAMCEATRILVFSLNHAAKSSVPLLAFGSKSLEYFRRDGYNTTYVGKIFHSSQLDPISWEDNAPPPRITSRGSTQNLG